MTKNDRLQVVQQFTEASDGRLLPYGDLTATVTLEISARAVRILDEEILELSKRIEKEQGRAHAPRARLAKLTSKRTYILLTANELGELSDTFDPRP